MKHPMKFFAALFITLLFSVSCLSIQALAAENTLGTEEPYLYCVYYNSNNEEVDGNALPAGEYTVDIMLEGMQSVSVFQYTAEYDPSVVTEISTDAAITEEKQNMSLGGIKTADADNGKKRVVLALASTDESGTALDQGDAATIATMTVTVACNGTVDFEDYFDFVSDPDLTFIEADYSDGIEDAYVLDTTTQTSYATYLMTADVTPENELEPTITVSGKVLIALDAQGSVSEFGLRGVKIYAYDNDNQIIAETVSNAQGDKSTWGDFSLEVPAGTTNFMVGDPVKGADSIVNRGFTVAGDADVTGADIPVVMCDYNDDGYINTIDKGFFLGYLNEYNVFADFNNDTYANTIDKGFFLGYLKTGGNGIVYAEALSF